MKRIPFSQVLKNASIDIRREYDRLYDLFCVQRIHDESGVFVTLKSVCAANFMNIPFRGTSISLEDFDNFYGFHFKKEPTSFDIDYLVSFCEYSYNLAIYNQGNRIGLEYDLLHMRQREAMQVYIQQVTKVVEAIGYMGNSQDSFVDFIPKDQVTISVAEIVDPVLSYRVIEYNHHSMKGDLTGKKAVLISLAEQLEPQRTKLRQISGSFEADLFFLYNSLNIRHNNVESSGKYYIPLIATMKKNEIEQWYDDIYQMSLQAFLQLEQIERRERISKLKEELKGRVAK